MLLLKNTNSKILVYSAKIQQIFVFNFGPVSNGSLKVPKCEIFDSSDFHDFYTIKSRREGDFGVK